MSYSQKILIPIFSIMLVLLGSPLLNSAKLSIPQNSTFLTSELYKNILSFKFEKWYKKQGIPTDRQIILKTLSSVSSNFDSGLLPITEDDIVALLMCETLAFSYKALGPSGEVGLGQIRFQYLPRLRQKLGYVADPFKIDDNIKMTLLILREKKARFKTRKNTIIGYNGFYLEAGKVKEKYWHLFSERLVALRKLKEETSKELREMEYAGNNTS